jgi:hypothetical protein
MRSVLIIFFLLMKISVSSQITVRYVSAKRAFYSRNDTLSIVLVVKIDSRSCLQGMKKTYLYFSGCEDIGFGQWQQFSAGVYRKYMIIHIKGNTKNRAKLTITRNTDKESFFRQEIFNIK